jgi:hypothetical protein
MALGSSTAQDPIPSGGGKTQLVGPGSTGAPAEVYECSRSCPIVRGWDETGASRPAVRQAAPLAYPNVPSPVARRRCRGPGDICILGSAGVPEARHWTPPKVRRRRGLPSAARAFRLDYAGLARCRRATARRMKKSSARDDRAPCGPFTRAGLACPSRVRRRSTSSPSRSPCRSARARAAGWSSGVPRSSRGGGPAPSRHRSR